MLEHTRPNLRILHPLPRVNEIAYDVDENPKAYYFQQAQNGLYARQAILCDVLGITLNDVIEDAKKVKTKMKMSDNKQALQVAALKNGTVIDHIPSDKLFTVVALLGLQDSDSNITIGNNFESKKLGKKGIIKVADRFFTDEEISRLSVVAPNVKLNIIRDYEV